MSASPLSLISSSRDKLPQKSGGVNIGPMAGQERDVGVVREARTRRDRRQEDAESCLLTCKESFLDAISADRNQTLASACRALTEASTHAFWPLYWCDSTFCGVWVGSADQQTGLDPNVDLIINECQGIGIYSVLDPGPPPTGFRCPSKEGRRDVEPTCNTILAAERAMLASAAATVPPTSRTTIVSTWPSSRLQAGPSASTQQSIAGLMAPEATASALAQGAPLPSDNHLSQGAQAGMAVCTVFGLFALLGLVLCMRRRRQAQPQRLHTRPRLTSTHGIPLRLPFGRAGLRPRRSLQIGSQARLADPTTTRHPTSADLYPPPPPMTYGPVPLSPAHSHRSDTTVSCPLLTPPPRLCDRQFLPWTAHRRGSVAGGAADDRHSNNESDNPPARPFRHALDHKPTSKSGGDGEHVQCASEPMPGGFGVVVSDVMGHGFPSFPIPSPSTFSAGGTASDTSSECEKFRCTPTGSAGSRALPSSRPLPPPQPRQCGRGPGNPSVLGLVSATVSPLSEANAQGRLRGNRNRSRSPGPGPRATMRIHGGCGATASPVASVLQEGELEMLGGTY